MDARRQLIDQQSSWRNETLHRHYADVVQFLHDRAQHRFSLLLLCLIRLRQRNAGAQNAILMQVVRQRIEHHLAIVTARPHQ